MMCILTQRELDFIASLKSGWRRLCRRELVRLLKGDAEASEVQLEARPMVWRVVSGLIFRESLPIQIAPLWWNRHS